ncbi:MAG: ribonuclease HII [Holosporales bacterium]|jgi:ribonuclease HII|nr:ribonuclease HII [Holosporales bacterium]
MSWIVGIDEVGCGALAGPVVAAACWLEEKVLASHPLFPFVRDSKTLSEKKREEVAAFLVERSPAHCRFAFGQASREEIDALNILRARLLAMVRAYQALNQPASLVLVDGPHLPDLAFTPVRGVIKGDALDRRIAGASIVAKVFRDHEMRRLHPLFPVYGWDRNKGYGTEEHRTALHLYGRYTHHRISFCKNLPLEKKPRWVYNEKQGQC